MVTTRSLSMLCTVRPYFRQCTPPEFSATLPPMRAGDLAGGIGRVVQAVGRGRLGDRQVAHAGLHARGARDGIDLEDALHLRQRRASRPARAASRRPRARCRRRARPPARAPRGRCAAPRCTCSSFSGSATASGTLVIRGQAVAFVGLEILALVQQARGRQHRAQAPHQFGLVHRGRAAIRTSSSFGLAHGQCDPVIRMARKSLTLVSVGPVTTRSPRPEKKL